MNMNKNIDKRLDEFINEINETTPPAINERIIQLEVKNRKKRWTIILLSFGSLLWIITFTEIAFILSKCNMIAAFALLGVTSINIMCSGLFSYLLFKFRKVGVQHECID